MTKPWVRKVKPENPSLKVDNDVLDHLKPGECVEFSGAIEEQKMKMKICKVKSDK